MNINLFVPVIGFILILIGIPTMCLIIHQLTEETKTIDTIVLVRDGSKTIQQVIGHLISKKTG